MDEKLKLYEKANFYLNENISVHIIKKGGWFHNGMIVKVNDNMLVIIDEKTGATPLFFDDIADIRNREAPIK